MKEEKDQSDAKPIPEWPSEKTWIQIGIGVVLFTAVGIAGNWLLKHTDTGKRIADGLSNLQKTMQHYKPSQPQPRITPRKQLGIYGLPAQKRQEIFNGVDRNAGIE